MPDPVSRERIGLGMTLTRWMNSGGRPDSPVRMLNPGRPTLGAGAEPA